jgi:micrococcal nuclease
MKRRFAGALLALVVVLAGCAGPLQPAADPTTDSSSGSPGGEFTAPPGAGPAVEPAVQVHVVDVVDGDTVRVRFPNGTRETVRLIGVDTPEIYGSNTPGEFEGVPDTGAGADCLGRFGDEASAYATDRLAGETVGLAFDDGTGRRGFYGRLLAYVYVDGRQFNYALVARGYARLYESSFAERDRYAAAEAAARKANRGLWTCRTPEASLTTGGRSTDSVATTGSDRSATSSDDSPTTGDGTATGLVVETIHADASGNDNENLNDEYVVFRNAGETPLAIGGWTVTEGAGREYVFPAGTTLAPGATITLHTGSGSDSSTDRFWGQSRAVWNNDGDTVTVRDESGRRVLTVEY